MDYPWLKRILGRKHFTDNNYKTKKLYDLKPHVRELNQMLRSIVWLIDLKGNLFKHYVNASKEATIMIILWDLDLEQEIDN